MVGASHGSPYGALTDELVEVITNYSPTVNARAHRRWRESALRTLKGHRYGRTNQFEVHKSLDGLVERFDVLGSPALADALRARLDKLASLQYELAPEALSLLLNLSEKPAEKANLYDLDTYEDGEPEPELTWSEIIRDDPLDDDKLWEVPDYHANSSEEDEPSQVFSGKSREIQPSSADEDFLKSVPDDWFVTPDYDGLKLIEEEQKWRAQVGRAEELQLTEFQVLRESIHMLMGKPTTLFEKTKRSKKIVAIYGIILVETSASSIYALLASMADIGHAILSLRAFVAKKRSSPLLQTFASEVEARVHAFDTWLCTRELHLLNPRDSRRIVSLLAFEEQVRKEAAILMQLHHIVAEGHISFEATPFRLLDAVLEQCTAVQALDNNQVLEKLSNILFSCLTTHLTPLISWMQSGELDDVDEDFLAQESSSDDIATFWQETFRIRLVDGTPQTPSFLQPFVETIFASGKSVAFLHQLGLQRLLVHDAASKMLIAGSFTRPNANDLGGSLIPFATTLHNDLTKLMSSTHQASAPVLTAYLLNDLGLLTTLTALQTLFLSRTGSIFAHFADSLFLRLINPLPPSRFIIAELARSAFATDRNISPRLISVALADTISGNTLTSPRQLHFIHLRYAIPPVLQNIILPSQQRVYERTLTTLLTLRLPYTLLTSPSLLRTVVSLPAHHKRLGLFLRQRLLFLLNTILDHYLHAVIQIATLSLEKRLSAARSVDELVDAHRDFVALLERGLLQSEEIKGARRAVEAMIDMSVGFVRAARQIVSREETVLDVDADSVDEDEEDHGESSDNNDDDDDDNDDDDEDEDDNGSKIQDDEDADAGGHEGKNLQSSEDRRQSQSDHYNGKLAENRLSKVGNRSKAPPPSRSNMQTPAPDLDAELRLRHMRGQLSDLAAMLIAQLRTASRETGTENTQWVVLAERLEWGGR